MNLPLYTNLKILREMKGFENHVKDQFCLYGTFAAPILTSITLFLKRKSIFHKYQCLKVYFGIVILTNIGFYFLINNPFLRFINVRSRLDENCFNINNIFADFSSNFESSNNKIIHIRNKLLTNSEFVINKDEFKEKIDFKEIKSSDKFEEIVNPSTSSRSKLYNYLYLNWLIFKYESIIFNFNDKILDKRKIMILIIALSNLLLKYEMIYEKFDEIKDYIFTKKIQEEMIHKYIFNYAKLVYSASKKLNREKQFKKKLKIKITNQDEIEKKSKNTLEILNFFYRKLDCYDNPRQQFLFNIKFDILRKLMNHRENELFFKEIKLQSFLISQKNSKLYEFYPILYDLIDENQLSEMIKNIMIIDKKNIYSLISNQELSEIKNRMCDYDFQSNSKILLSIIWITICYCMNFSLFNLLKLKKF